MIAQRDVLKVLVDEPDYELDKFSGEVTDFSSDEIRTMEEMLASDQHNLELRTRLLTFYFRRNLLNERVKHIFWFVNNYPDWKFCGTRMMAVNPKDEGFDCIRKLWFEQVKLSDSLIRRINAYLFLYAYKDPKLEEYFESFFRNFRNNIWFTCLQSLSDANQLWLEEIANEELNKPVASLTDIAKLHSASRDKSIHQLIVDTSITSKWRDFSKLQPLSDTDLDFHNAAIVAGHTWRRAVVDSVVGFDPEVIVSRLKLASWIIRRCPTCKFATEYFFLGPFYNSLLSQTVGNGTNRLIAGTKMITSLWLKQISEHPDNPNIANNAKSFAKRIEATDGSLASLILERLEATSRYR